MSISFVNAAGGTTSVTMPAGRTIDDLELMFAFRNGSTAAPTAPSDWFLARAVSGNTCWGGLYYRWCISASDVSGTFTNASELSLAIYRGCYGIGAIGSSNATGTSINYPALTFAQGAGNSWAVGGAGHRTATTNPAPAGMTQRNIQGSAPISQISDSNGGLSSWSSVNSTVGQSSGHSSIVCELLADSSAWSNATGGNGGTAFALSSNNKVATSGSGSVLGTFGRASGKRVFSITPGNVSQFMGLGLADQTLTLQWPPLFGADDANGVILVTQNSPDNGIFSNTVKLAGTAAMNAAVTYVAVDLGLGKIWIKNSAFAGWNDDPTANPATGVGGLSYDSSLIGKLLFPAVGDGNAGHAYTLDTSSTALSGASSPAGFTFWDDVSSPAPPVNDNIYGAMQAIQRAANW